MHKTLERQLKKIFGSLEAVPKELNAFVALVNETYVHNDEDRALVEHSLDISSKEMGELNAKILKESGTLKTSLAETERMNKLMVDRELKMIELKKEIEALRVNQHKPSNSYGSTNEQ